jgi:hypothetical protein
MQDMTRDTATLEVEAEKYIAAAITAAREVYAEPSWVAWAESWLSGADRSGEQAGKAFAAIPIDPKQAALDAAIAGVTDDDDPAASAALARRVREEWPHRVPNEHRTQAAGAEAASWATRAAELWAYGREWPLPTEGNPVAKHLSWVAYLVTQLRRHAEWVNVWVVEAQEREQTQEVRH